MTRMVVAVFLLQCVIFSTETTLGQIMKKQAIQDSSFLKYEGVLTNSLGGRVTGEFLMTFRIYKSPDSSRALWEESHNLQVRNGEFQVTLGKTVPVPLLTDQEYYLGVFIDEEELLPRQSISGSPRPAESSDSKDQALRVDVKKARDAIGNRDDDWNFWDNPPHMFSMVEGNIGIGTPDPSTELDVNGTLTASDLKLNSDSLRVVNVITDTIFFFNPNVDCPGAYFISIDTSRFNGVMDNTLTYGYNVSKHVPGVPALWTNIESNYYNGTDSLMELNWNYYSADGQTFRRPLLLEIDRNTHSVDLLFYADDARIIGKSFRYYPNETTGEGFFGIFNSNVMVSDTAEYGGLRMQNIDGSGVQWGMHVADDTQAWWLGLSERRRKFVEIDTTGQVLFHSGLAASDGMFSDDEGDTVFLNTTPDRGVKIVYNDDRGYALDIKSDSDAGIQFDINGSATSGVLLPFDPTLTGGGDYFGINLNIKDGSGADFRAHGLKIGGPAFDREDEHLIELYDPGSDGLWGIHINGTTHDLQYYYNDSLVISFDTLGIDSASIADGSLSGADLKDSLITGEKIAAGVVESSHLADSLEWASTRYVADSTHYWDVGVHGAEYDLQFIYNEQDTFTIDTTGLIDGGEIRSSSTIDIDSVNVDHVVVNATLLIPTYTDTLTGTSDTLFISGMTVNGLISLTFLEDPAEYSCEYQTGMVIVNTSTTLTDAPYRYGVLAY